jgi:hypothetical protein
MLTFVKTGDSPLMSFMKFSHMFRNLSSTRLSQFHSNTEKFVPDGFQECSHLNTSRNAWVLLSFLERYFRDGDEFLDHIVTGVEAWVSHCASESKQQSQEWHHAQSPTQKKKTTKIQQTH